MSVVHVPNVNPAGVAIVSVLLPTLSTLSFAARIYDRKVRRRIRLAKDDWALLASLVGLWALAVVCLVGVGIGALGKHSIPPQSGDKAGLTIHRTQADDNAEMIVQAYSIIEKFAFLAYKASVCFAYRSIFPSETYRRICLGVLMFLCLQCVAFVTATGLQCSVRNWGIWYQDWAMEHKCAQAELVWVGYTVSEVAVDLFLLLSPMPFLLRMNLELSKKISTIIVFSLGGLSVAVGIARMSYLLAFTYTGEKGYRDLLGLQSTVLVWSLSECAIAILASNISALRKLIFRDRDGHSKGYFRRSAGSRRNSANLLGSDLSNQSRLRDSRALGADRSGSVEWGGTTRSVSTAGPPALQELDGDLGEAGLALGRECRKIG